MFGLFKSKSKAEKLQKKYDELIEQSYKLSTISRVDSDKKAAEADAILKKIEELEKQ